MSLFHIQGVNGTSKPAVPPREVSRDAPPRPPTLEPTKEQLESIKKYQVSPSTKLKKTTVSNTDYGVFYYGNSIEKLPIRYLPTSVFDAYNSATSLRFK